MELALGSDLQNGWTWDKQGRGQILGLLVPFLSMDFKGLNTGEARDRIV